MLLVPWSMAATNRAATAQPFCWAVAAGNCGVAVRPVCLERIRSRSSRRLCFQKALCRLEVAQGVVAEAWVLRVDVDQRLRDHRRGGDARKPLAVRRDHVPRRPGRARVAEHLRERLLVVVPGLTLLDVVGGELPVVVGKIDAPQEASSLLLARKVQEELHDPEAVLGEIPLPVVDRVISARPDVMLARLDRKLLPEEVLRMHPDDEHLLVVRPVEDADLSARREPLLIPPEEVLIELRVRRDLEALDPHPLWVDAAHHVADRPVLSGRIECLKNDQHAMGVLRGQSRLVLRKQLDPALQEVGTVLLLLDPGLEARVEVLCQLHARARGHPEGLDELRDSFGDVVVVCHPRRICDVDDSRIGANADRLREGRSERSGRARSLVGGTGARRARARAGAASARGLRWAPSRSRRPSARRRRSSCRRGRRRRVVRVRRGRYRRR